MRLKEELEIDISKVLVFWRHRHKEQKTWLLDRLAEQALQSKIEKIRKGRREI